MSYPRIATLKTADQFRTHCSGLGLDFPLDEELISAPEGPLAESWSVKGHTVGNRFCILPMEGWDGTVDGKPTELTQRRWKNFGRSGAKLIWGGEAIAVRHDGRANPNQLMLNSETERSIAALRQDLVDAHEERFETSDDLLIGLQLTHSGRFARPNDKKRLEPRTVYQHPFLDQRFQVDSDSAILTDDELKQLIDQFIATAKRAASIGFSFVDIKHCHAYLGHELLTGYQRPGLYGGSFENRTRFLREIIQGIQTEVPGLEVGVRVSTFDFVPFVPGEDGVGTPCDADCAVYAFGADETGVGIDLDEPKRLLEMLQNLDVRLVCTTAGTPYYNPHLQRPAFFPPSDGYQPPEDPLVGVHRQMMVVERLKSAFPELRFVGSGYSYLQEWLPLVGQAVVRRGMADSIGIGRMVLSYPELPADALDGIAMQRKKICRTFSDCTTAPRNGMISGCFPLDPFYKVRPEREALKALKQEFSGS